MTFEYYGNDNTSSNTNKVEVDFKALNAHVVEAVDCKTPQTVQGVISQIIDLGLQKQPDAKFPTTDDEDTRKKNTEEGKCYYEFGDEFDQSGKPTGKQVWFRRWKNKPLQEVAIVVDFPSIIVDKGQFFGESNPAPYRLVLGGDQWDKDKREFILNRPAKLRVTNLLKDRTLKPKWSLGQLNTLYKMAVAGGVIENGDVFLPNQIGDLLGKSMLFEVSCKINDKGYLQERIKLTGKLMRGMEAEELPYAPKMVMMFDEKNDMEAVKELRSEVINHLKRSESFAGSALEEQLASIGKVTKSGGAEQGNDEPKHVSEDVGKAKPEQVVQEEEDGEDFPF